MAKLRTFEEKAAIVQHCVELENAGGDILGYLWSEDYLTPRATWFNMQREWLHRKPYEFTDGKPKKGEKSMQKRRQMTDAERAEAVRIAMDGIDPRPYLESLGYADPQTVWNYIKKHYRETAPEVYAQIPKRIGTKRPRTEAPAAEVPTVKVDGGIRIETPEANRIQVAETPEIIDGVTKEITVHEADIFDAPEGMVPRHMLKHPVKVNIVKDKPNITKPVNYDGMIVREVEGEFARYRRTDVNGNTFIDVEFPDGCDTISFTVGQWGDFRKEHNKAALILGVEL